VRHRSGSCGALIVVAAALALPAATPVSDVTVTASGLRSSKGVIRACMTADPVRFPRCTGDAAAYRLVIPAAKSAELRFHNVTPGRYAIALLHDENANGKADRALSMIPKEGFGFSRDAPVRMGPPKFGAAAFKVDAGDVTQAIHMRYML
jgi:uncharacterized protein (DUF2141 family)